MTRVEFQVTGEDLKNEDIGTAVVEKGFWVASWSTTDVPNGTYVLRGVAFDAAGDQRAGEGITVKVAN